MAWHAATGPQSCGLTVNIFSGARMPFPATTEVLLTVIDGNQKEVHRDGHKASSITLEGLPFHDNFADNYTVLAWAKGYSQAGITPVKAFAADQRGRRYHAREEERRLQLQRCEVGPSWAPTRPEFARVLSAGAADDASAARTATRT